MQSRITSPARAGIVHVSTSTCQSAPSARVITDRCGCRAASSGASAPALTHSATSEWSSDRRVSTPPRHRYARESPTWAKATEVGPTSAAVTVEPMPEARGSEVARSATRRLASRTVEARRSSSLPSPVSSPIACTAMREASSPASAPPMPSATANRGGSA